MSEYSIDDLLYLMRRLRDPGDGCPWDLQQDFKSIAPYTIEEVYELIDTLERGDHAHLLEELGDVLFQIVFYARLGEEQKLFDFHSICSAITEKLVARHPHVFPQGTLHSRSGAEEAIDTEAINNNWEALKREERERKGKRGLLDDIPLALPALLRAQKLQKRAANSGFDWPDIAGVIAKLEEELVELEQAMQTQVSERMTDELGDILFCCVNLARHLSIDAEQALRTANRKFQRRFEKVESLADGRELSSFSLVELDEFWNAAKKSELT